MSKAKYVVGVDVGGTNIKIGIVQASGKVIARTSFATKPFASSKTRLIAGLAQAINAILEQAGIVFAAKATPGALRAV